MRLLSPILFIIAVFFAFPCFAQTENPDLDFSCVARKFDQDVNRGTGEGGVAVTKESWGYVVTLENKTFKDMEGLEVKYIIFFRQETLGSKAAARLGRKSGSNTIDSIKAHDKTTFDTENVELKQTRLIGNYIFMNGAKPNAEGRLAGLWVRVYQQGKLLAELCRPPQLSSKEKWE
jgi:hypothetical protein